MNNSKFLKYLNQEGGKLSFGIYGPRLAGVKGKILAKIYAVPEKGLLPD